MTKAQHSIGELTMSLEDFDDRDHRIASASACLQRGIYHLFVLKYCDHADRFAGVLRVYQCLYQLCSAMLLLDHGYSLKKGAEKLPGPLKRIVQTFGGDPKKPKRTEIEPSATINHSVFEDGKWNGFPTGHVFNAASTTAIELYHRVANARHIVIYRPMLRADSGGGWYWDECPLLADLNQLPTTSDVEAAYVTFCAALHAEHKREVECRKQASTPDLALAIGRDWTRFFAELRQTFKDMKKISPTETILKSYARVLQNSGVSEEFVRKVTHFQNELFQTIVVEEEGPSPEGDVFSQGVTV